MRDLEARLRPLGFRPRRTWWLRAIDVDLSRSRVSRGTVDALRRAVREGAGD
jgi:hypothetical protein